MMVEMKSFINHSGPICCEEALALFGALQQHRVSLLGAGLVIPNLCQVKLALDKNGIMNIYLKRKLRANPKQLWNRCFSDILFELGKIDIWEVTKNVSQRQPILENSNWTQKAFLFIIAQNVGFKGPPTSFYKISQWYLSCFLQYSLLCIQKTFRIFPLTPMGVLATRYVHARSSA